MIAPKPHSQPKPKRLPKRLILTIAAGFVCRDGIVIAADTKESYGDTHTYVDKIVQVQSGYGCGTIAGSGNGDVLDYIGGEIRSLMESQPSSMEEFDVSLRNLMVDIYGGKAMNAYPVEKREELTTQLLVTYSSGSSIDPHLFLINSSLVTRVSRSAVVIGCGPLRQLADELGSEPMYILEAPAAALYVVHEAKRRYSDVGGITRIVMQSGNLVFEERTYDQPQREAMFDATRKLTQRLTIGIVNPAPFAEFDELLRDLNKEARAIRKTATKLEEEFSARQEKIREKYFRDKGATPRKSKRSSQS